MSDVTLDPVVEQLLSLVYAKGTSAGDVVATLQQLTPEQRAQLLQHLKTNRAAAEAILDVHLRDGVAIDDDGSRLENDCDSDDSLVSAPHQPPIIEGAIAFNHMAGIGVTSRRTLLAYPQSIFKGQGLWLWGATPETLVHNIKAGNRTSFSVSHAPIPGLYFEAGLSFADFEAMLDRPWSDGDHQRLSELPPVPSHQRITLATVEVGNSLVLDVEGPLTHAVMWGKTIL